MRLLGEFRTDRAECPAVERAGRCAARNGQVRALHRATPGGPAAGIRAIRVWLLAGIFMLEVLVDSRKRAVPRARGLPTVNCSFLRTTEGI